VKKGSHKNQIIITTLALLLAVVGYISYDNRDTFMNAKDVLSTEIEAVNGEADTQVSDEVALETDSTEEILNAGETVLTSASTESEECVAQVKLGREQVRSKNKEALQKIIDDAEFESKNYGEDFMTAGEPGSKYSSITLATREIIAGANEIIGEVRDSKIGAPATGADVNYIESPFARNSIIDFYDNIMSCKHALYGGWNVVDQPTATSLLGVCLKVNNADMKAAAQNAQTKLDAALNKISNMKKPFVLFYTDQSAKDAMAALDELESALDALDGEIEKFSGNATLETEFKKVNEAFVKNTVIPTYRALADNDLKLLNSLKKITWKK